MSLSSEQGRVLAAIIEKYFQSFVRTSALDIARSLSIPHGAVMEIFEELCGQGYGRMNANVELNEVSFDLTDPAAGFIFKPITTHIFFPSGDALRKAYYASDLPQKRLPEYQTRLHLGAPLYALAYFREEVLGKYFAHPEGDRQVAGTEGSGLGGGAPEPAPGRAAGCRRRARRQPANMRVRLQTRVLNRNPTSPDSQMDCPELVVVSFDVSAAARNLE